ncbi:MAG: hypothetical protein AAFW66_12650 [Pseudomonadota bacterium]
MILYVDGHGWSGYVPSRIWKRKPFMLNKIVVVMERTRVMDR